MTTRADPPVPEPPVPESPPPASSPPDPAAPDPSDGARDPLAFAPVPTRHAMHNGWTPARQWGFIEALADTGSVQSACRAVGMQTGGAYRLRRQPGAEGFCAAWAAALDHGMRRVEDVAMDRALNGVEQPIFSYGKRVGTRVVINDRLLMFLLRNRVPERFANDGSGRPAADRRQTAALKAEWHAEWAAEQREEGEKARKRLLAELEEMAERLGPGHEPPGLDFVRALAPEGEAEG